MFIPNTTGKLYRRTGKDMHSEPTFAAARTVLCAIVHLNKATEKTAVRADQTASRGNAEQFVSAAKLLFPANVVPVINDKFEIRGFTLRVIKVEPRLAVTGKHDHNEVDLAIWQ